MKGEHNLKVAERPDDVVTFRFVPNKKNGKVVVTDIIKELFDNCMSGNLYAIVFKVPEEYPSDLPEVVDLYEPEDAAKICARWSGYKLIDSNGNEVM